MNKLKILIAASLIFVSSLANAEVLSRTPITHDVQECTEMTNGTGALVGAGVGYAAGRLLFGKGAGGLFGAATGGLVGSQVQKPKQCATVQKIVGYKIIRKENGKIIEDFERAQ